MRLKIKYMPYENFREMGIDGVLNEVKKGNIVLVDAKLASEEEINLINITMEKVSERFKGIEMASFEVKERERDMFSKMRHLLSEILTGRKRGITLIGPAKVIRKIKRNPEEAMLYIR